MPNFGVTIAGSFLGLGILLFVIFLDRAIHRLRPVAVAALVAKAGRQGAPRGARGGRATRRACGRSRAVSARRASPCSSSGWSAAERSRRSTWTGSGSGRTRTRASSSCAIRSATSSPRARRCIEVYGRSADPAAEDAAAVDGRARCRADDRAGPGVRRPDHGRHRDPRAVAGGERSDDRGAGDRPPRGPASRGRSGRSLGHGSAARRHDERARRPRTALGRLPHAERDGDPRVRRHVDPGRASPARDARGARGVGLAGAARGGAARARATRRGGGREVAEHGGSRSRGVADRQGVGGPASGRTRARSCRSCYATARPPTRRRADAGGGALARPRVPVHDARRGAVAVAPPARSCRPSSWRSSSGSSSGPKVLGIADGERVHRLPLRLRARAALLLRRARGDRASRAARGACGAGRWAGACRSRSAWRSGSASSVRASTSTWWLLAVALATTALGTLVPILSDARLLPTPTRAGGARDGRRRRVLADHLHLGLPDQRLRRGDRGPAARRVRRARRRRGDHRAAHATAARCCGSCRTRCTRPGRSAFAPRSSSSRCSCSSQRTRDSSSCSAPSRRASSSVSSSTRPRGGSSAIASRGSASASSSRSTSSSRA